ncbi:MAG TPA: ThuA domain-containing protein [Gemmataceae bacterium]|nr:ThuA domain-containing protein [Gemmataceae bacterium]
MKPSRLAALAVLFAVPLLSAPAADEKAGVVLPGKDGAGQGKHIVLISGDQEYRSEEAIPQLAKILATRHGFKCTVLFTVDPADGTINPVGQKVNGADTQNIPGLAALKSADLMVIFTRFLNLPDDQMEHIVNYLNAGKPVVGLRTATHAFNIPKDRRFAKYSYNSGDSAYKQGFGKQVLGETWVNHHGAHGKEGTRGIIALGQEKHPILRGIKDGDVFGTTDVYTVTLPLPEGCTPLVLGQVTETLQPDSKPVAGKKNDPMMPVAWTNTYHPAEDIRGRVFTTTMGASQDLQWEGTRRLIVNGCYWAAGLEAKIPDKSNVEIVGEYKPTPFRGKGRPEDWKPGVKPADLFK